MVTSSSDDVVGTVASLMDVLDTRWRSNVSALRFVLSSLDSSWTEVDGMTSEATEDSRLVIARFVAVVGAIRDTSSVLVATWPSSFWVMLDGEASDSTAVSTSTAGKVVEVLGGGLSGSVNCI